MAMLALPAGVGFYVDQFHEDDIRITSLRRNQSVVIPRCLPTLQGTGALEAGHHLWIAIEFPDRSGGNRIVFAREATMRNGTWRADKLTVGGANRSGETYVLTAVGVDGPTHGMLATTVIDMFPDDGETLGPGDDLWRFSFRGYPTGAEPLDDISVTRNTKDHLTCAETAATGQPKSE
ncbi:hypothetical protein ACH4M4_14635 [Streptomyces sp. NPDC017254]|uniref:hypothetical protein n=1 Tax=unclassified Streptomyces TaxID=2593676 RepID=UPI0037A938A3